MGTAVCGTHYAGKGAASYKFQDRSTDMLDAILISGEFAAQLASMPALLYCYWVTSWSVASSVSRASLDANKRTSSRGMISPGQSPRSVSPPRGIRTGVTAFRPKNPLPGVVDSLTQQHERDLFRAIDSVVLLATSTAKREGRE